MVSYFDLVTALLNNKVLTEAEALDRKNVEAAATDILAEYIRRWKDFP